MTDSSDAWKPWPVCLAGDCEETKDVKIMECVPGYSYMMTGGVCKHVGFLAHTDETPFSDEVRGSLIAYFRQPDVPRETKE